MKSFYFLILFAIANIGTSFAQRIVYVDTNYVLNQMSEYTSAQAQMEEYVSQWNAEIAQQENDLLTMRAQYEQNKLLMPEATRIENEQQIEEASKNLTKLKQQRFGTKGDLFKKQQDLIKPIQDRVYKAIKQMSEYRDYDMVLDRATGVSILYAKPKLDMSDEVLRIVKSGN